MPRLKPPPNYKEDPPKTLEVELEPDNQVTLENEGDNLQELATDTEEQKIAKREAAREYRQKKKEEEEALAASNSDLKRQLEEMKAAVEDSRKQAQEAQRRQAELDARIRESQQESNQYLSRAEEAEYQAVLTAMAAAEGEADSGNRDLEAALTNQDHKAAADAQRRIARAEAKLVQLEEGKNALEARKSQAAARAEEEKRNPPKPQNLSVDQQIDAVNALLPSQKTWLKAHPDAWTDQRKNMRLQGAHVEAEDQGLTPGTQKYFDYLEERLGYKQADTTNDDEDDEPRQTQHRQERRTLVSAPVSRDTPSNGGKSKTKITLSEKELEAAQISGVDPQTYARNMLKLKSMKEDGYYDN
ncbi:MAG TPA: hypothetical protein VIY48_10480 [Candidatus Paceibacterota bacterium]